MPREISGPGRSKLFGNSADGYLKVHDRAATEADVTDTVKPVEARNSQTTVH